MPKPKNLSALQFWSEQSVESGQPPGDENIDPGQESFLWPQRAYGSEETYKSENDGTLPDGSILSEAPQYWEERYRCHPQPFDWLNSYVELRDLIEVVTEGNRQVRILYPGCGNSLLPENMYDVGYFNIVNLDVSATVIQQMNARNHLRDWMTFRQMDVTDMSFVDGSFDVVIDKGMVDTFSCSGSGLLMMPRYISEVDRVLRPGGTFFVITIGAPSIRLCYLEQAQWSIRQLEIPPRDPRGNPHWAYICIKW